jgi:glutathione peroxidase
MKQKDMTLRQTVLKTIYPVIIKAGDWFGLKSGMLHNEKNLGPSVSFYSLAAIAANGHVIDFSVFKGKKLLIVNTASDCGYTQQYEELQNLHEQYGDKLTILAFPANDFKEQEKATDEEIAQFCKVNFGVTFQLMKKSRVVKGLHQNHVFAWLSHKNKNGWNDKAPEWNFSKYLVNEQGILISYFAPAVSPLSNEVTRWLN